MVCRALASSRRGAAHSVAARGGSLADVLQAGQWRSPAFARYLDKAERNDHAVSFLVLCAESDTDDDCTAPPVRSARGGPPR